MKPETRTLALDLARRLMEEKPEGGSLNLPGPLRLEWGDPASVPCPACGRPQTDEATEARLALALSLLHASQPGQSGPVQVGILAEAIAAAAGSLRSGNPPQGRVAVAGLLLAGANAMWGLVHAIEEKPSPTG